MYLNESQKFLETYSQLVPGGSTFSKSSNFDRGTTPASLVRGKGSKVWDVDGNSYIDFISGLGAISLGYCFEPMDQAVREQLKNGISFMSTSPLEVELAEKLVKMIPSAEMVRYGKNGSDVLSAAVRLCRHIKGREHIITGGYHGWHEWSIAHTSKPGGIPKAEIDHTHKFRFNDIESLEKLIHQYSGKVACVVMDTVARYYPEPGFLEAVRELTEKNDILLVFDEVVTGFRIDLGGAQKFFNVTPDFTVFGKAVANGMPLSVLVGKEEYMRKFDEIFYAHNFAAETLSLAGANAVIDFYQKVDVPAVLYSKGKAMKEKLEEIIKKTRLDSIYQIQGMPQRNIIGMKNAINTNVISKKDDFLEKLSAFIVEEYCREGFLFNSAIFLTYSHTDEDIAQFLTATEKIYGKVKDQFFPEL